MTDRVKLGGNDVSLGFRTAEDALGNDQVSLFREIQAQWPNLWPSILSKLGQELEDDGPDGERVRFLRNVRPIYLEIQSDRQWELIVDPQIYEGHIVTLLMRGLEYESFRLDG